MLPCCCLSLFVFGIVIPSGLSRTVSHVVPDVTGEVCQEPLLADAIERPGCGCSLSNQRFVFTCQEQTRMLAFCVWFQTSIRIL